MSRKYGEVVSEHITVPVDDEALNLLESALDYYFSGEDENGDPVGVGEFSLYQLLDFWSGFDPSLLAADDDNPRHEVYRGGPLLTSTDVMRALIAEIRRLRSVQDS